MSERKQEEEYFARLEREKREKLKAKLDAEQTSSQIEMDRELHHHRCGKCGGRMDTKVYRGVEIEMCTRCGAVLLDPGELEALAGEDQSGLLSGIKAMFGG